VKSHDKKFQDVKIVRHEYTGYKIWTLLCAPTARHTIQQLMLTRGAENAGVENAGVEKSGAMTDGEPSV